MFLKISIPILTIGFLLTTQPGTQAYRIQEAPAPNYEWKEIGTPYENQLTELDKEIRIQNAQLDRENTISFEQYDQYQSTLTNLLQDATSISREVEAISLTAQFEQLVIIQKKIQEIDVK